MMVLLPDDEPRWGDLEDGAPLPAWWPLPLLPLPLLPSPPPRTGLLPSTLARLLRDVLLLAEELDWRLMGLWLFRLDDLDLVPTSFFCREVAVASALPP